MGPRMGGFVREEVGKRDPGWGSTTSQSSVPQKDPHDRGREKRRRGCDWTRQSDGRLGGGWKKRPEEESISGGISKDGKKD